MLIQNYNKKSVIPQILPTFCCHACHAVMLFCLFLTFSSFYLQNTGTFFIFADEY